MSQATDDLAKYRAARDKILTTGQSVRIDMGNGGFQQWQAADLVAINAEITRLERVVANETASSAATAGTGARRIGGLGFSVASF